MVLFLEIPLCCQLSGISFAFDYMSLGCCSLDRFIDFIAHGALLVRKKSRLDENGCQTHDYTVHMFSRDQLAGVLFWCCGEQVFLLGYCSMQNQERRQAER